MRKEDYTLENFEGENSEENEFPYAQYEEEITKFFEAQNATYTQRINPISEPNDDNLNENAYDLNNKFNNYAKDDQEENIKIENENEIETNRDIIVEETPRENVKFQSAFEFSENVDYNKQNPVTQNYNNNAYPSDFSNIPLEKENNNDNKAYSIPETNEPHSTPNVMDDAYLNNDVNKQIPSFFNNNINNDFQFNNEIEATEDYELSLKLQEIENEKIAKLRKKQEDELMNKQKRRDDARKYLEDWRR